jgi:hypothetical protein
MKTTRTNRQMTPAANRIQSSGFGESKVHASGEGLDPKWHSATINGQPIPEHIKGKIPWSYTDEGAREANAGKGRVYVTEIIDKVQREAENEDLIFSRHPLEALSEGVAPEYHKRFLSPLANDRAGGASARGYEVVKDERGDPVRHGSLVLARMPKRRADRIRASRMDESERNIKRQMEHTQQEQERISRDTMGAAGSLGPNDTFRERGASDAQFMGLRSALGAEPTAVRPPE